MIINAIKTERVTPKSRGLIDLLLEALPPLKEGSVVAVTSKIVALCEGRVVPFGADSKAIFRKLIEQESELFTDPLGAYGFQFTVAHNTLIPSAGIDESNGSNNFVLWPEDIQGSANEIWQQLRRHYGLQKLGVIITDSTCKPLRRGTIGIALAHCGFEALNDYVGQPDLFGRPFKVSQASVAEGLAAAAVLTMGEGTEQTPVCLIEDASFITFVDSTPGKDELENIYIPVEEDLFAPLIQAVEWHPGQKGRSQ